MNVPLRKPDYAPLVILFLAVAIVAIGCSNDTTEFPKLVFVDSPDCADLNRQSLPVTNLTLNSNDASAEVAVEIAGTSSQRAQGLMCRESVPSGTGMLFTYDTDLSNGFWMKNTYVPLEILYIDSSRSIVDKIFMAPCPRGDLSDGEWEVKCATEAANYVPKSSWRYTLELPAGWLDQQKLSDIAEIGGTASWD